MLVALLFLEQVLLVLLLEVLVQLIVPWLIFGRLALEHDDPGSHATVLGSCAMRPTPPEHAVPAQRSWMDYAIDAKDLVVGLAMGLDWYWCWKLALHWY